MVLCAADCVRVAQDLTAEQISSKCTVTDMVERVLMAPWSDSFVQACARQGVRCWRGVAGPGSVVFLPAGTAVLERCLGGDAALGFCLS